MQDQRIRGSQWRPPSDELVLAAVDRAQRHRATPDSGDPTLSDIAEHLGMTWGPVASRRLRPIIDRLTRERGWLQRSRRRGQDRWALSDTGSQRLARAGAEGIFEQLPESQQHREWRAARAHAAARIEPLRGELRDVLANVNRLLDASEPVASADWLACVEPLRDFIEAVAMASFCLYELAEPDDAAAVHAEGVVPRGSRYGWRHPRTWDPGHGD
jgi:hypothetical protein